MTGAAALHATVTSVKLATTAQQMAIVMHRCSEILILMKFTVIAMGNNVIFTY